MIEPDLSIFPGIMPVPDHPDLFAVPDGRIISTREGGRPRVLRSYLFRGHYRINLSHSGTHEPARVHQLIAITFCGPRPSPEHSAIHINGNRLDNTATNIKWATALEKVTGQVERGTQIRGIHHHQAKLNDDAVREIRFRAARGATNVELAGRYGVSKACIHFCVNRRTWKHVSNSPVVGAAVPQQTAGATNRVGLGGPEGAVCEIFG